MKVEEECDVGILIALTEEFRQLHGHLPSPKPVKDDQTGHHDYLFEYPVGAAVPYRCVATFIGKMGPENAAVATERFIARCQPSTIVMMGIAGGISEDVRLGDVVVGTYVNNYLARAKAVPGSSGGFDFEPGGDPYRCSDDLVQATMNIEFAHGDLFKRWHEEATQDLQECVSETIRAQLFERDWIRLVPSLENGPIASGPVVGAAEEFCQWLKRSNRTYLAIEMEGGGMLIAACTRADPKRTILLRAISDFGDERKAKLDKIGKGGLRRYAMNSAVRLFWRLLDARLLPCGAGGKNDVPEDESRRSGRTRPDSPTSPEPRVFLAKLPTTSGDLFGRERELAVLDAAWAEPRRHVAVVSAWGGVGKTALVNHWLNRLEPEHYRGAACVYGWSFYSQGTREDRQASGDTFLAHALEWFGDPDPNQGAPWDKGVRLAGLIRKQRTLLLLDGLEPLQYPPGAMQGRLRDQGVLALLKELARAGTDWGLCVVTTRVPVPELEEMKRASVQSMPLESLSDKAGAHLLRNLGVIHGTDHELRDTSHDFKGHALALTLLGRFLAVVHNGEIRKRDLVPALEDEEAQGGHATRVMKSYALWLKDKPELDILHLLGLFDRPADGSAIQTLREEPAIYGLTNALHGLSEAQWQYAVQHLRELRLLDRKDDASPDTLDCHPLLREHFGAALKAQHPTAWKEAHARLYEHYKALPEKLHGKLLPDTIEEMEPLFRAVTHGCQAGRYQETMDDVYWPRVERKEKRYSTNNLGAFGADLAALCGFFEVPWIRPVAGLADSEKAFVLSYTGFCLRGLGRLREAREPMKVALQMRLREKAWKDAAQNAGNLSEVSVVLGNLQDGEDYGRQAVALANRSDYWFFRETMRATLASALHQSGEFSEADRLFREAEALHNDMQPGYPLLYSVRGYLFCDLLLSQGQFREVQERASQTLKWVMPNSWLLDIALDYLSLGRAVWIQGQVEGPPAFREAASYLDQAVRRLREAGAQYYLPRGLLSRAALYRVTGAWADVGRDLAEAQEIAERGDMQLFLADYHLESARLFHAVAQASRLPNSARAAEAFLRTLPQEFRTLLVATTGGGRTAPESSEPREPLSPTAFALANAREHLAIAKEMVARMGYGRRNPEVEELEKLLAAE